MLKKRSEYRNKAQVKIKLSQHTVESQPLKKASTRRRNLINTRLNFN